MDNVIHRSVVVTGGCGFIGSHLVSRLLKHEWAVTVLDNLERGSRRTAEALASQGARMIIGDIRNQSDCRRAIPDNTDFVVHLAAMHFIPDCDARPAECVSVNVAGTARVIEELSKLTPTPRLVLASTGAVYAPSSASHTETDPLGPTDVYGASKVGAEAVANAFAHHDAISVRIARLFNVFGPGETNPHLIPALLSQMGSAGSLQVGALTTVRDYVHVSDIAAGLEALCTDGSTDLLGCYNISTGIGSTGEVVVDALQAAWGTPLSVDVDVARMRRDDRPRLVGDSRRLQEHLGWRPAITLTDGIEQLVSSLPGHLA